MSGPVALLEQDEVLAAARRFRRDGYKVTAAHDLSAKPDFLGDFVPDFIAERDDDKVIVEVKRANAVRGSNDIVEIAARVAAQPGWRFELIALPDATKATMPDLKWGGDQIERLLDRGFSKPAFVLVYAMIENVISFASMRKGGRSEYPPSRTVVRDLVVRGLIDESMRRQIDDARGRRNLIIQDGAEPAPTRSDVEALMKLGCELEREVMTAGAA